MVAGLSVSHPASDVLKKYPHLFVLSGPSGVGKDSVLRCIREQMPEIRIAVTATTRAPRPGEVDGHNYYFVSQDKYVEMQNTGELLAPALVHGNWYGAPMGPIRRSLDEGHDVLLKIDVQGAAHVREVVRGIISIFLAPPSLQQLMARLRRRHTEDDEELRARLEVAPYEVAQLAHYDYAVVNREGQLEDAVENVSCIIRSTRLRTGQRAVVLPVR